MMLAHAGVSPWEWHPHPDVWALVAFLVAGYWVALRRLGPRLAPAGQPVATRGQLWCFVAGALVLWVHADWPVHDLGEHYLFSVHMAQHIGFTLIAAPLLLLGTPPWLQQWLLRPRALRGFVGHVTRPLAAGVLFNTVTVLTHWPVVVDGSLRNHGVHFLVHALIFTSALIMWFPVLNRFPGLPSLSYPGRMLYLFLQSVIPTVPASFLTFGSAVIYDFYKTVPRPWAFSALEDQQLAGAMMKVYAGLLLWGAIIGMFFKWYSSEGRDRSPDVLTWDDVERELRRTDPARPAAVAPATPSGTSGPPPSD